MSASWGFNDSQWKGRPRLGKYGGAERSVTGSISVGSSPLPGLLTRLDTGHIRRTPSGAGLSNSVPALPDSQGPMLSGSRITGIRSWMVLTNELAVVMIMLQEAMV